MKRLILEIQDDLVPQVLDFLYSLPKGSFKIIEPTDTFIKEQLKDFDKNEKFVDDISTTEMK